MSVATGAGRAEEVEFLTGACARLRVDGEHVSGGDRRVNPMLPSWLEWAAAIGNVVAGFGTAAAVWLGLGAWKEWERKRERDRRADVATRIVRLVAVTCEDLGAAILGPALRIGWAELVGKQARGFVPIDANAIRDEFERRMQRALEQVRELFKLHVEARVHLDEAGEVEALARFMLVCQQAEESARAAVAGAEDDPMHDAATRRTLKARLAEVNQRVIDAREHVVYVLTPVARSGAPGRRDDAAKQRPRVVEWTEPDEAELAQSRPPAG